MLQWGISSTVLIGMVCLLRQAVKEKISLRLRYALWLLVALRLLLPVNLIDSGWSVLNLLSIQNVQTNGSVLLQEDRTERQQPPYAIQSEPDKATKLPVWQQEQLPEPAGKMDNRVDREKPQVSENPGKPEKEKTGESLKNAHKTRIFVIWLSVAVAGFCLVMAANVQFYVRLCRTRKRVETGEGRLGVYETRVVCSPCLFGLAAPAIYLPNNLELEKLRYVLAHEYTHYRHLDHIWVFVRLVCVCLHWYNPAVWLAAYLSGKDCELACDEGAILRLGESARTEYGQTLLELVARQSSLLNRTYGTTMMTGTEKSIRERIVHVARKTDTSKLVAGLLLLSLLVAVLATFTGNAEPQEKLPQDMVPPLETQTEPPAPQEAQTEAPVPQEIETEPPVSQEEHPEENGEYFIKKEASDEEHIHVDSMMTEGSGDTSKWTEAAFAQAVLVEDQQVYEALWKQNGVQLVKLAQFENEQITIYAAPQMNEVIVECQGQRQVFQMSFDFMQLRTPIPNFSLADYDLDGRKEIFTSYTSGTGTGFNMHLFCIFDTEEKMFDRMYEMTPTLLGALGKRLEYSYQNGQLSYGIRGTEFLVTDFSQIMEKYDLELGSIGTGGVLNIFADENRIFAQAPIGCTMRKGPAYNLYLGEYLPKGYPDTIQARLQYLGNGTFEVLEECLTGNAK